MTFEGLQLARYMALSFKYGTKLRRVFNQARCLYSLRLASIPIGWDDCHKLSIECIVNKPDNLDKLADPYKNLLQRFEKALLDALAAEGVSPVRAVFTPRTIIDEFSDKWEKSLSGWKAREHLYWRRMVNSFLLSNDYKEEYARKSTIYAGPEELQGLGGIDFFNKLYSMHEANMPDGAEREREFKERLDNPSALSTL